MNTILTLDTEFCKITKELKVTESEDYETCDILIREFARMLVDASWQPCSVKKCIIDLACEYQDTNMEIL